MNGQQIRNPKIKRIVESIDSLPTLPDIATEIFHLSGSDDTTISELVTIINKDPSLASQLLKVANSPFYGFLGRIASIEHAVALIGMNELKNIAVASALSSRYVGGDKKSASQLRTLWKHAAIVGFVSRLLGEEFAEPDVDALFLIGLIHNIGAIIVMRYMQEEFGVLMERARSDGAKPLRIEKEVLGATHCEIGALTLKKWQFPPTVVLPVLYHHEPWRDKGYPLLSTIIHFADAIARILGYIPYPTERPMDIDEFLESDGAKMVAKSGYDVSKTNIERLLQRVKSNAASTEDFLPMFSG